jgi:CIC family chloride channel protein
MDRYGISAKHVVEAVKSLLDQDRRQNQTQSGRKPPEDPTQRLGDFTTSWGVLPISGLAVVIGIVSAFVALALLRLIGIFTNLFFFQRWGTALVSPANNRLGWWEIIVPVIGALIVGFMARYGSERIRGHGIPEAIEAILLKGGSSRELRC